MAKISLKQWRKSEGLESEEAFITRMEEVMSSAICPVLCDDDDCSDVEPDGQCQHGHPSVMLEAGLI
jgi:hypothetical protein